MTQQGDISDVYKADFRGKGKRGKKANLHAVSTYTKGRRD